MQHSVFKRVSVRRGLSNTAGWTAFLGLAALALLRLELLAATESPRMSVVPKWGRFEEAFKSATAYANPLQDATLTVRFVSPLGQTNLVYGFWDGEKTWRVRFSPDQPGRWTFRTVCSDTDNQGLNNRMGEFLCTAAIGKSPFHVHGPVRVARNGRHLEYADGTPFFWLADTAWDGARMAELKNWDTYALLRSDHRFTAVQWAVGPGDDLRGQSALGGFPDRIAVEPEFFQRLDEKVADLSYVGLVSAIAPLVELEPRQRADALPDDQAALLVRYTVARWGADPVVWLLAFDGSNPRTVERWKRIGQAVFSEGHHAPVMVCTGPAVEALDAFRAQPWVDLLSAEAITDFSDAALGRVWAGPFAREWSDIPPHPLIPSLPCENGLIPGSNRRYHADDVRRAAYWSELLCRPAGLSYAGYGVAQWDTSVPAEKSNVRGGNLPLWRRAMYMPGAKQMAHLANFMTSTEFWRLQPALTGLVSQPGASSAHKFVAAAVTEAKDLGLVYLPEDGAVQLAIESLPPAPMAAWYSPLTGESLPAAPALQGKTCRFQSPKPGDWLLVLRPGRP